MTKLHKTTRRIIKEVFGDEFEDRSLLRDKMSRYHTGSLSAPHTSIGVIESDKQPPVIDPDHEQALQLLFEMERAGKLESPPIPAQWDFAYLRKPITAQPVWSVEMGKLIIQFTQELLDSLMLSPTPQFAHVKSNDASILFETTIGDESSDVRAKIQAKGEQNLNDVFGINVTVEISGRKWPQLAKVPVELSLASRRETQLTDAFGKTRFSRLAIAELPTLSLTVGPIPEIA